MPDTLVTALDAAARRSADRPALQHGDTVVRYGELAAGAVAVAGRLRELGAGRRVGVLLPNVAALPLVHWGILRAGRSALLLNPLNSPREVAEYLADAAVDEVFTAAPLRDLLPAGTKALLVDELPASLTVADGDGERALSLGGAPAAPPLEAEPAAEAAVLYTAASDGWGRGAPLSHRNLLANAHATVEAMGLVPDDRVLAVLPLIHAFGLTVSLHATLLAGATLLPMDQFHPVRALELLEGERITVFAGVPAMFIALLAAAERRGVGTHALRVVICGGAPLDAAVQRRWEETFGVPLRQGYGLTEAGPVCLFNRVDRPNRIGTLGYPFPGVEVSVRDLGGEALPAEEVGELCVRGDNVFGGYLGDGGRRPKDFHGDWLRTGDLVSQDSEGAVRFRGVVKPMFTRNGFNVYPAEVERVLGADARVARAVVCALPHPARENDLVLQIEPVPGAELTEDDVRELCRRTLASYKQPTRVEIRA